MKKILYILILVILIMTPLTSMERGDQINATLAVIGPGDELYFRWGHIGIVMENTQNGQSRFYDYGLFSFQTDNFYRNFAMGRLIYSVGASPVNWNYERNVRDGRSIHEVELNLSGAAKIELWNFLENNIKPENREYLYHHFDNNCATKIRDILNDLLDGQLKPYLEESTDLTLRDHTRRHLEELPFYKWFLSFIMGPVIDRPLTEWDELFLPGAFLELLNDVEYMDEQGHTRKLVSSVREISPAVDREPVPAEPRTLWPYTLIIGLILAILGLLSMFQKTKKRGRILGGTINLIMGLYYGGLGTVMCFLSFFTNHDWSFSNINLFMANPFYLILIPLSIGLIKNRDKIGKKSSQWKLQLFWSIAGTIAILLLILLPFLPQKNEATLAIFLPPALTMSFLPYVIRQLRKK